MKQPRRRATYQYGTLTIETRSRGPNVWAYRYFERVNGAKKRRKAIIGTLEQYPSRAAAERACEHVRLAANAEINSSECPTIQGLVNRYIEQVLRPCLDVPIGEAQDDRARMGYQTARSYQSVLERWVLPRWGTHRLHEFGKPVVRSAAEDWFHGLGRSPHNPTGLAPKTVRSIFTVMKLAFKFGVKWGYLRENPMAEKRVELPRGSTKRLKEPVQLTPAGFFTLLARLGLREQVAVAFAGWLGPRVSEAFGLQWRDVDLAQGVVSFRRGFVQGRITPLKTEASRTNLPVPEELRTLLGSWRSVTPYNQPEDWLFASSYTKGRRPFWPGQLFKTYIKPVALAAGLPNIGWHSFRHTVSAWGKEAGLELEEVKTLLRHENIVTTSDVYGTLGLEAKRRIQDRLVEFVKLRVRQDTPKDQRLLN
ncbi:MAG: tyrosine-type recombinase/integrase [Terriglobales bacterium]